MTIRQQTTHLWLRILQTLSYCHWLENLPTLEAIDLSWKRLHQDCKLTIITLFPYQFQEKASIPRFQLHWILVGSLNNNLKDNYHQLLSQWLCFSLFFFLSSYIYSYRLLHTNYTYCYSVCNYKFWTDKSRYYGVWNHTYWRDYFRMLQLLFVSTSSNSVPLVYTVLEHPMILCTMNQLQNAKLQRSTVSS